MVVATGGGWMARRDISRAAPGCARVWLRVSPVTAFERLATEIDGRPLLSGPDPEGALKTLSDARETAYAEAEFHVDTTGLTPGEVAARILQRLGA